MFLEASSGAEAGAEAGMPSGPRQRPQRPCGGEARELTQRPLLASLVVLQSLLSSAILFMISISIYYNGDFSDDFFLVHIAQQLHLP
jgi:hypothetical protein